MPLVVFFTLVGAVASAQAQDVLKAGGGATVNYATAATWNDNTPPTTADDVIFDRSLNTTTNIVNFGVSAAQNANSITFGSTAVPALGAFVFQGGAGSTAQRILNISTGNITVHDSVTGTISLGNFGNTGGDLNSTLNTAASGFTLTNNSTNQELRALWRWQALTPGQAGKDMTFSTAGGAINLHRNAPGWGGILGSLNGGSSATSIVNSAAAALTPVVSALTLNGTGSHSFAGIIKDGTNSNIFNSLVINSSSLNQTLTGASTYSGGTTVTAGTLVAGNASALGTGNVDVAAAANLIYNTSTPDPLTIGGNLTIAGGGTGTIGTTLNGGQIIVTGAATLVGGSKVIDVYGPTVPPGAGIYTLIQGGPGSDLSGLTLGSVFNANGFTVTGFTASTDKFEVTIAAAAQLTTAFWKGGFSTPSWAGSSSSSSNWSATAGGADQGLTPIAGTDVIFSATAPISPPVNTVLGANSSIKSLTISDTINGLGLNADGNTLTLGTGGITMSTSVPASTIAANVALGVNQSWVNNSTNPLTVSGTISEGSPGLELTKSGTGALVLAGANTYSGSTTISAGTLQLGDGTVGKDGTLNSLSVINNANLTYNRFGSISDAAAITGSGSVTKTGSGTQILSGANNYSGVTTVEAGVLTFRNPGALYNGNVGSWTPANINVKSGATLGISLGGVGEFDTAALTSLLGGLATSSSASNGMNAGANLGFDISTAAGEITISDLISDTTGVAGGSRGIVKLGTGTLTLDAANTYSGKTTVNAGTLKLPKIASLYSGNTSSWTAENINVKSGGRLILNVGGSGEFSSGNISTLLTNLAASDSAVSGMNAGSIIGFDTTNAGGNFTIADAINNSTGVSGGARSLLKLGAGTLTLTNTNLYTGITTLSEGTLQLGDGTADGSITSPSLINNGNLIFNISGSKAFAGAITGSGTVTKVGAGTQSMAPGPTPNTYTGATTVTAGTLTVGFACLRNTSGVTVSPGATLDLAGTNIFVANHGTALGATRVITVNGGTLLTGALADMRLGNITLSNGAIWTSDKILTGFDVLLANVSTGAATVSVTGSGVSTMNGMGGIHLLGVQNFNVEDTTTSPAADLDVSMILAGPGSVDVAGTGGINKTGLGTMKLSAANTYNGTTTVSAGTLDITGSIVSPTVSVNADATLSGTGAINGAVQVTSGGHLAKTIAATPEAQLPLTITGALKLDTGNIIEITAAAPPAGGVYTLVTTTAGIMGTPETVNLTGVTGTVSVSGNNLILTVDGATSPYSSWATGNGLNGINGGANQDPDFDDIENQLEFALGGNPLASDASILPALTTTATDFVFAFNRADASEAEIGLTFQYGSTLTGWTDVPVGAASAGQVAVAENGTAADTVVITIPRSNAVAGKLFGRLKSVK
jgi:fibronectin-binding autotransporter adhesin